MIEKRLTNAELEAVYDLLAEAVDAVALDQQQVFLAKLALVLANMLGDVGQVTQAVAVAKANLGAGQAAS